jgi:hypothetical protein
MTRKHLPSLVVAIVVAVTRLRAIPRTCWQPEEIGFTRALLTFDPMQQQPDAPGYPLVVGLGKLVNAFVHDPFASLIVLSVVASIAGAVMLTLAFARILNDEWAGAAGAALVYLSPAMLVFTPLPNAEAVSMALIAATLLAFARGNGVALGICAAATVAARPQTIFAMLVLLLFARNRRAFVAFIVTVVICFEPMLEVISPAYLRANWPGVAGLSAMRLIAHPWGSKALSLPLLAFAALGAVLLVRSRNTRAFGVALFAIAHLAFCFIAADRNAGVQPMLPALVAPALFAAASLRRFALPVALAYGAGALVYTQPLIASRTAGPSPPIAAVRSIATKGVVVYEPALEPFVRDAPFATAPLAALDTLAMRPDVEVLLLADGGATTFAWPDSDAYGKVTTEHYRVVSVISLPPPARYVAGAGVYQLERTIDGREWRWLAQRASITVPPLPGSHAQLTLALPADAATDRVIIDVNGATVATVIVKRGETVAVDVPVPSGAIATLTFRADHAFAADSRTLAVQLLSVSRRSGAEAASTTRSPARQ